MDIYTTKKILDFINRYGGNAKNARGLDAGTGVLKTTLIAQKDTNTPQKIHTFILEKTLDALCVNAELAGVSISVCGEKRSPPSKPGNSAMTDMNWRTIDSAPKDGDTEILLRNEETGICIVAFWNTEPDNEDYRWETLDGPAYHKDWAAHWMPLPDPPK